MIIPTKNGLPHRSSAKIWNLDDEKAKAFQTALKTKNPWPLPPTWGAIALDGIFEILNNLEVDWRHLLHGSQSFTFDTPVLAKPIRVESQAELVDYRHRNGVHWLNFETAIRNAENAEILIRSKSLIFVKEAP